MQVHLTVNGKDTTVDVPPHTLLVQVLREQLKLTGTHVGCDTAQCGACTVMKDGRAIKSCNVLAAQVDGSAITTIEGVAAADGTMHPMQGLGETLGLPPKVGAASPVFGARRADRPVAYRPAAAYALILPPSLEIYRRNNNATRNDRIGPYGRQHRAAFDARRPPVRGL